MKGVADYDLYEKALCRGMDIDLFFPERGVNYNTIREIKKLCKKCPVRVECFEVAMAQENDNFGIFGGTTPKERRKIRSERYYGNAGFFYASIISDDESAQALDVDVKTKKNVA